MTWSFRENSLDAIRLFAATQVAILHVSEFMFVDSASSLFLDILRLFPGVPIFFLVSGYLISKSYESTPRISEYGKNRILRLYPALVVCVALNLVLVWSTGVLDDVSTVDIGLLFFAKSSVFQFYNPDFMRSFGDGVLNGSLWTICVEVQFYLLTPLLYTAFSKDRQLSNVTLISLIVIFLAANRMLYIWADEHSSKIVWKLYRVSFAPWFYMFLTGILLQRNFDFFVKWTSKVSAIGLLVGYSFIAYVLTKNGLRTGNEVSPVLFILAVPLVFRAAYFMPERINSIMRGNDISYGIYIWHMPVVNQMLYMDMKDDFFYALIAMSISLVLAIFSWRFIEKPALKLKRFTLNARVGESKR